ncbi:unnamed protein product, partial [Prorocentrum cordatum]
MLVMLLLQPGTSQALHCHGDIQAGEERHEALSVDSAVDVKLSTSSAMTAAAQDKTPCDPAEMPKWAKDACDKSKTLWCGRRCARALAAGPPPGAVPTEAPPVLARPAQDFEAGGRGLGSAALCRIGRTLPSITAPASDPAKEVHPPWLPASGAPRAERAAPP